MGRSRNKENKALPARWRFYHGAYYYQVPPGQEAYWDGKKQFRLGEHPSDAYRVWSERIPKPTDVRTVNELLDRFMSDVVPTRSLQSRLGAPYFAKNIRKVFGEMPLTAVTPQHIYKYFDMREAKLMAAREVKFLSGAYFRAVEWGYIKSHPFTGQVRYPKSKPRDRYIEDWEIEECLNYRAENWHPSIPMMQSYIRLKLLLALRKGDMLSLKWEDFTKEGIKVTPGKTQHSTNQTVIFVWTRELRKAVAEVKKHSPYPESEFLFPVTRWEATFKARLANFAMRWNVFMAAILKNTKLKARFNEHDLRAKVGSDEEDLGRAQQLLTHANPMTTKRSYRRRPQRIKPAR